MERRKKYLRFAAFVPAIVLGVVFIGCRSGVFDTFSTPEPKPEPQQPSATPQAAPTQPNPPVSQPQPAPEKPPVIMSGTKSIGPIGIAPPPTPPNAPNPPPANAPAQPPVPPMP